MVNNPSTVIVQLTKSPSPGNVKTRLIPALGEEGACVLHKTLTRFIAESLSNIDNIEHQLWSSSGGAEIEALVTSLNLTHKLQQGDELGARIQFCVDQSLKVFSNVMVIGSDCPFLNKEIILDVQDSLNHHDVVFIPATDGGYVLVAVKENNHYLFEDIPWGSSDVLQSSIAKLEAAGARYKLHAPLSDIDRPEDLSLLNNFDGLKLHLP